MWLSRSYCPDLVTGASRAVCSCSSSPYSWLVCHRCLSLLLLPTRSAKVVPSRYPLVFRQMLHISSLDARRRRSVRETMAGVSATDRFESAIAANDQRDVRCRHRCGHCDGNIARAGRQVPHGSKRLDLQLTTATSTRRSGPAPGAPATLPSDSLASQAVLATVCEGVAWLASPSRLQCAR